MLKNLIIDKMVKYKKIARVANAFQCHSQLSGHNYCPVHQCIFDKSSHISIANVDIDIQKTKKQPQQRYIKSKQSYWPHLQTCTDNMELIFATNKIESYHLLLKFKAQMPCPENYLSPHWYFHQVAQMQNNIHCPKGFSACE